MDLINNLYQDIKKEQFANKIALQYFGQKITYKKLWKEIDKVASVLTQFGIKKGDCISIALPNVVCAVTLLYGANKIGAVCNMMHPLLPVYKLRKYAQMTKSKMLFVSDVVVNEYADQLFGDYKLVVCNTEQYLIGVYKWAVKSQVAKKRSNTKNLYNFSQLIKTKVQPTQSVGEYDQLAIIMHGGGTTGEEKAVMLSNGNFISTQKSTIDVICGDHLEKQRCMLCALPLFHAFGLGACLHTMLANGIKVLLLPAYSTKQAVKLISKGKINYMAGVPTLFDGLTRHKDFPSRGLRKLRYAFCGSDRLPKSVKERFDNAVKSVGGTATLDEGYGLTECTGVSCVNTKPNFKQDSMGLCFSNSVAEVFENGKKMPRGTQGEICIGGEGLFLGYFDDEKTTNQVVFQHGQKRWLKTGDWGCVDQDGYIYYKDRIKRIAKVGGITVFPSDVEREIEKVEGVARCLVAVVAHPYKGSVLKAFLEVEGDQEQILSNVKKTCRQKLAKWERPVGIEIKKLPLTASQKIDFKQLNS